MILADQTPTPTRLLNNCEELRVFDDLQNINPFEEGFRRAVEDGSNGLCFLTTPSNQDTLHTPQILPQFEHRLVKKEPNVEAPIQDEPENLTLPTTLDDSNNIPKTSELSSSNTNDLKNYQKPPIPLLPKPSIIYAAPIVGAPSTIQFLENDANKSNESVKDRLKNIILSNSGLQIDRKRIKTEHVPVFIGTVPLVATTASLIINNSNNNGNKFKIESVESNVITESNVATQKSGESGGGSRKRARVEKSESSSLKVERNRAAARRYR